MLHLSTVLIPILLADIVNPVLFAVMVYAVGTDQPVRNSIAALLGHTTAYLTFGIGLALTFDIIMDRLANPAFIDYILSLLVGTLHLWAAWGAHLLLGRDAIVVIGVMRFEGLIFGSPHTDQWTQVLNRRSYKFVNPDHYLQHQINAVRLIAPGARVSGWHLFSHGSKFPKDKPGNVLQPGDVRSLPKRPRRDDIPKQLHTAWEQLVVAV